MFIADEYVQKWPWPCTVSFALFWQGAGGRNLATFIILSPRETVLSLHEAGSVVTSFIWNILNNSGCSESNRNRTVIRKHIEIC